MSASVRVLSLVLELAPWMFAMVWACNEPTPWEGAPSFRPVGGLRCASPIRASPPEFDEHSPWGGNAGHASSIFAPACPFCSFNKPARPSLSCLPACGWPVGGVDSMLPFFAVCFALSLLA